MSRLFQTLLIASTLVLSWLGMQAVHELGHVLGAWAGGETVGKVLLHPLTTSRTDASHDRHPLLVVWGGPIFGSVLPLLVLGITRLIRSGFFYLFQFFAGFCLVANGAYLALGSFDRVGDCGEMLRHGSSPWQLWLFGAVTVPAGLALWNRQGPHFGLGPARRPVRPGVAWASLAALVLLLALALAVDGE